MTASTGTQMGTWTGPEDYHGPHPAPHRAGAAKVPWHPVYPPVEPFRTRESTCRCSALSYELCSNGSYWIRRTTPGLGPRLAIAETVHMDAAAARVLWTDLLTGRAY